MDQGRGNIRGERAWFLTDSAEVKLMRGAAKVKSARNCVEGNWTILGKRLDMGS